MNKVTAFYGDAEFEFALTLPTMLELERKTGTGIGALCSRIFSNQFGINEIQETIRLALIGGGMDPQEAVNHVTAQISILPIETSFTLAVQILEAAYFGTKTNG